MESPLSLITVAICSWNRSDLLARALTQLSRAKRPRQADLEVVVVNNGCTDDTDKVIASFEDRLPLVRVFEPSPGLSNARNAAIASARGQYILWMDDDVLVCEDWFLEYEAAFHAAPDASFFGGPILPLFEGSPPRWLQQNWHLLQTTFSILDLPGVSRISSVHALPFGANYAVRMREQLQNPYDPRLGRQPSDYTLVGEETSVLRRIVEAGGYGLWLPRATVRHWIPRTRQNLAYVWRYHEGVGRTAAILGNPPDGPVRVYGIPVWKWRMVIRSLVSALFNLPLFPSESSLDKLMLAAHQWGGLCQLIHQSHYHDA